MDRADTASAAAEAQGIEVPKAGTKAWLELVLLGREAQLAAAEDAVSELEAQAAAREAGDGSDHPLGLSPAVPLGSDAYIRFTAVRQIPGAVVGPGLAMENPSYDVLRASSYVWVTEEEYAASPRRLACTPSGIREVS